MSADEWDADDFEPPAPAGVATDKWDGEDEGDDVKEAWDAEEEEKKTEDGNKDDGEVVKAVQRKKKKPLAERIAEKEAERIAQEKQEKEGTRELTKEEKYAEAERLKKIQEEADLRLAKEAFGVDATGIDAMFPVTEEEFTKFAEVLKQKITSFSSSKHYGSLIEKLVQDLVLDVNLEELKKISTSTNSLYHERQRLQKEQDKKGKKKKGKGTVTMERDFNDIAAAGRGDYDDDYEDDFI